MHTTMKNSAADDNTIGKNIFHFDGSLSTTETVADNMTEDATNPPEKADTGKIKIGIMSEKYFLINQ